MDIQWEEAGSFATPNLYAVFQGVHLEIRKHRNVFQLFYNQDIAYPGILTRHSKNFYNITLAKSAAFGIVRTVLSETSDTSQESQEWLKEGATF